MKKKLYKISYIFNEIKVNMLNFGVELMESINIYDNILIKYFRVKTEKLDFSIFKNQRFVVNFDKDRTDVVYVFFDKLELIDEFTLFLKKNKITYPNELDIISLNCNYEDYVNKVKSNSISNVISKQLINYLICFHEDGIDIKMNSVVYNSSKKEVNKTIQEFDRLLNDKKFRRYSNIKYTN